MEDERKAVLERVARGELSPADAAALLDDLEEKEAPPQGDPRDWTADWVDQNEGVSPPPPLAGGDHAARIRVSRAIGTVDIIGDPSVREAIAEGPHSARREADTLVIEGPDEAMPGFVFNWAGPSMSRRGRYRRSRHPRFGWGDMMPLQVRVNPDLPLQVDAQASKLRIRGVHAPIRCGVQAGSAEIVDFRSSLELNVQAGSVTARGRIDQGASRIHCDAGSVRISLERGSSVRVSAHSTLGKVTFDHAPARSPWIVGGGEGTLDIDATMGSINVMAD